MPLPMRKEDVLYWGEVPLEEQECLKMPLELREMKSQSSIAICIALLATQRGEEDENE